MSDVYNFNEDHEQNSERWWMELEEGSLLFRRRNDRFDENLIVNLEKDTGAGKVQAHLATENGTEQVKLDLNLFSDTENSFCRQVGKHTSRTLFLGKFANIFPSTSKTSINGNGSGSSGDTTVPKILKGNEMTAIGDVSGSGTRGKDMGNANGVIKDAGTQQMDNFADTIKQTGQQLVEDECSPASLKKHQIGDHLRIKLNLLVAPGESREVRPLDPEHAKNLERDMKRNPDCNFTKLLLHIQRDPHEVDVEKLNSGEYTFEVLGGNHTRYALQTLGQHNMFVDAAVYAGLSDGQALCLGLQHNQLHKNAKPMTFTNYVLKFREHWEKNTKHLEAPTRDERSTFKDYLAKILRVPKQTISNSYRHHMFMITLVPSLWAKAKQLLLMWEKGEIIGQVKRPFNQCDAIVLERCADLGQSLEQLCKKKVSWKLLRTSPTVSKTKTAKDQEKKATDKKESVVDKQIEKLRQSNQALNEEIRTLKRQNEMKEEEIRMLRRKLEEAETTKEVGSRKDEDVKPAEDEDSMNVKEGEWIGVMFDSKCYLGQVVGLLGNGSVKTQFLTGRLQGRLSKRDVQCVHSKYIISKVNAVNITNGVHSLVDSEAAHLSKSFEAYKNKYM